jgi:hypothetical protein
MTKLLYTLGLSTFLCAALSAQIISNGSFESGINEGWSHLSGNGSAEFSSNDSYVRDGESSLLVEVNELPTSGYIRSVNQTFENTGENKYLLRFWAVSNSDKDLYVSVLGAENDIVHYEIRNLWRLYHLPFDTDADEVSIRFVYPETGSYIIDGVEVLDQNTGDIDVKQTFKWNEKYAPGWGWVAGDNDISLQLPDGRTVYFFNDSFYGYNDVSENEFNNTGSRFLRNAMVVEEDDGLLYSYYSGSQETTTRFFESIEASPDAGIDNFYWVGDAVFQNGEVLVYLVELLNTEGGATATGRTYIGRLSYPELEIIDIYPQENFAFGYEAFFAEGNYYYLYKTIATGIWTSETVVARCERNDLLGNQGTWRFYDGSQWQSNPEAVQAINEMRAESFVRLQPGNYVQITMPVLSREIKASFAPTPVGPWTEPQLIYEIPDDQEYWYYLPNIQYQLPNGKFQISYSTNSWEGFADAWSDKFWYRQRYFQSDLLGLSPYTNNATLVNLALDKPAYTGSFNNPIAIEEITDGSLNSAVNTDSPNGSIFMVDLQNLYDISQIRLSWGDDSPKHFEIYTAETLSNKRLFKTTKENELNVNDYHGLYARARYIGVRIIEADSDLSFQEIEVFGTSLTTSGSNLAPQPTEGGSTVFPNPFTEEVYVPLHDFADASSVDARLFDIRGKQIWRGRIDSQLLGNVFKFDPKQEGISELPAGIYQMVLSSETYNHSFKLIKN